jgi:hypothetical protein
MKVKRKEPKNKRKWNERWKELYVFFQETQLRIQF